MIELEQEDLLENSDLYDPADLDRDDLDSGEFPGLFVSSACRTKAARSAGERNRPRRRTHCTSTIGA
jgi:hypothetical protein